MKLQPSISSKRGRKRFGQHFLEPVWVRKLIDAIAPAANDRFLEIGPGRGALTLPLAARCRSVLAVEIDRDLAADLADRVPANVRVMTGDALKIDLADLITAGGTSGTSLPERPAQPSSEDARGHGPDARLRVAGNLPYNISTPILFRLIELHRRVPALSDATLLLQKEVADRLIAIPGTKDYGPLGIAIQLHADLARLVSLPPGAFRPSPRVSSALVRLTFRPPRVTLSSVALFDEMVRALFGQRRKTLSNALRAFSAERGLTSARALAAAGLDPRRRPETLQLTELAALADVFAAAARQAVL